MLGLALSVSELFERGFDALHGGRQPPTSQPPEPNPGAEALSAAELAGVERAVRALAEHDTPTLEAMGAYRGGADIYTWTRDYGDLGTVELVVPPGEPHEWPIDVYRWEDGGCAVDVGMYTRQEGWSDLTLVLRLLPADTDGVAVQIRDLLVQ